MAKYTKVLTAEPFGGDPGEMMTLARKHLDIAMDILKRIEKSGIAAGGDGREGAYVREKGAYNGEAYMPDYVLDEKGYIVDILPGSVRITLREPESNQENAESRKEKQ